jgi:hypothetical protein
MWGSENEERRSVYSSEMQAELTAGLDAALPLLEEMEALVWHIEQEQDALADLRRVPKVEKVLRQHLGFWLALPLDSPHAFGACALPTLSELRRAIAPLAPEAVDDQVIEALHKVRSLQRAMRRVVAVWGLFCEVLHLTVPRRWQTPRWQAMRERLGLTQDRPWEHLDRCLALMEQIFDTIGLLLEEHASRLAPLAE